MKDPIATIASKYERIAINIAGTRNIPSIEIQLKNMALYFILITFFVCDILQLFYPSISYFFLLLYVHDQSLDEA